MTVFITIVIVLLLLFLGLATYNRLVRLRKGVQKAWRQLSVHLRRRHQLATSLGDAMRGAVEVDGGVVDAMMAARHAAAMATGPVDASAKEGALSRSIGEVIAAIGTDATSPTHTAARALGERLAAADTEIATAHRLYNKVATAYNTAAQAVPGNMIVGLGNFPRAELFEPGGDPKRTRPVASAS